jgi:hypothetical protein
MVLQVELPALSAKLVPTELKHVQEQMNGVISDAQARRPRSGT